MGTRRKFIRKWHYKIKHQKVNKKSLNLNFQHYISALMTTLRLVVIMVKYFIILFLLLLLFLLFY